MRQFLLPLTLAAALAAATAHAAEPASGGTAAPPAKSAASPPPSSGTPTPSEAEAKVRFHGCGPEVSAVLGGDATTACIPDDPGTHGEPNESPESPSAWQGKHHPD